MQKHLRANMTRGGKGRIAPKRRIYTEALNPHFGFFYTVKKSLRRASTRFQSIELVDTDEFGKVLLLDNITQVAERNDHHYHEPMVHPALCTHPRPRRLLVIGGGDGGVLREALKHKTVERIELAELDEGVIEFSKKYLAAVHADSFRDPRVVVHVADGRGFTAQHPGLFDVVIMDMTDPFGPSKMLYTRDFFNLVKKSFRDRDGMFVMHSESPISRPVAFSCIQKTLRSAFRYVNPFYIYIQMYAVLWSITICSDTIDTAAAKAVSIERRLRRSGITGLKVYNGATHASMQVVFPHINELLERPVPVITDKAPDFPDNFIS
jgi:spermidine synthase